MFVIEPIRIFLYFQYMIMASIRHCVSGELEVPKIRRPTIRIRAVY